MIRESCSVISVWHYAAIEEQAGAGCGDTQRVLVERSLRQNVLAAWQLHQVRPD